MEDKLYDLCIIGAGMFGTAAARYASQNPKLKVCLIGPNEPAAEEMNEREIFSSHYDEGRIVQVLYESEDRYVLAKHTINRFREIEKLSGIEFYNPVGSLVVAEKDSFYVKHELQTLLSKGIAFVDLFNKAVFRARFPYLNLDGSDYPVLDDESGAGYISARKLVQAQKELARKQGCQIIEDVVCEVSDLHAGGFHVIVSEQSGHLKTKRVLFCTGAFTNFKNFRPLKKLEIKLHKETVVLLKLTEEEAHRLKSMPTIFYSKRKVDMLSTLRGAYILPPILYPDGHYYLKAGPMGVVEHPEIKSLLEVNQWYHSKGHMEVIKPLTKLLKELINDLNIAEIGSKTCLTCSNPLGFPYIDRLSPTVTVAVVGNGCGATLCDEVGRIAASLSLTGKWDSELSPTLFKVKIN